ncbi:MAG: hypothetical protein KC561_11000, partial [Myxococcales bacterium]|nr:hypothetical protein [Myxococcales bacterium]
EILRELSVSDKIKAALCDGAGREGAVLETVKALENGNWAALDGLISELGIDAAQIPTIYKRSVNWANETLRLAS